MENKKLTVKNGRKNRRSGNHADPLLSKQRSYVDDSDVEELDKGFPAKEKLKLQGADFLNEPDHHHVEPCTGRERGLR